MRKDMQRIPGSSLLQAATRQPWQKLLLRAWAYRYRRFELNISPRYDFGPSSIFSHSNNVTQKKFIAAINLLIDYWSEKREFAEFTLHDRQTSHDLVLKKNINNARYKMCTAGIRLYSHLAADKIKHAWRSRFIERNPRMAYILALQFEANLIHHEDHILLKIIVLLQIDAIIFALDSCWEKPA